MCKAYLAVTLGHDVKLLPKFIQYYQNLGIDNFLFILNAPSKTAHITQYVNDTLALHKIELASLWCEEFSESLKQKEERETIEAHCHYDDWVLYADIDEFQEYPGGLSMYLSLCDKKGINYLDSRLIDRVSTDGSLSEYAFNKSLELQYPLGGYITSKLLKGWDKKIVAARAYMHVGGGHHIFNKPDINCPEKFHTLPYSKNTSRHSCGIKVHHFKWDASVVLRMQEALFYKDESLSSWKKEMLKFLAYVDIYGRININDRSFKFKRMPTTLNI